MINKCPKCESGILTYNEEWDKEFDRLDKNVPAGDLIIQMLNREGIPKYKCGKCDYEQMG